MMDCSPNPLLPELDTTKTAGRAITDVDDDVDDEGSSEESSLEEDNEAQDEDIDSNSLEDEVDPESDGEKAKRIWSVCKIWDHYKGRLQNDVTHFAFLCAVHQKIHEHSRNPNNCDPEDREAVERIMGKLILQKFHERKKDRDKTLEELIHAFWEEMDDFHNHVQYFNKPHI